MIPSWMLLFFSVASLLLSTIAFGRAKVPLVGAKSVAPGVVMTALGKESDNVYGVAVQTDEKIVTVGSTFNGKDYDMAVLRYLPNGSLDPDFGDVGVSLVDSGKGEDRGFGIALQPDGKIVVVGSMANGRDSDFAIVRLERNGRPDRSFGRNGVLTLDFGHGNDIAYCVQMQKDGKIVVGGTASNGRDQDFALTRVDSAGNLDLSFGKWGRSLTALTGKEKLSDEKGYSLAIQPDGKIIMTGFSQMGENSVIVTLRYLKTGSLDPFFGTRGMVVSAFGPFKDFAYSVALEKNGNIVVGGSSYDGKASLFAIVRMLPDGKPDPAFGHAGMITLNLGETQDIIYALVVQDDGKITAGGSFFNGDDVDFGFVRITKEGNLDEGFGNKGRVGYHLTDRYDSVYGMALQPDGKIVATGVVSEDSKYRIGIMRLLSNGSPDVEFGGKSSATERQLATAPPREAIRAEMGIPVPNLVQEAPTAPAVPAPSAPTETK